MPHDYIKKEPTKTERMLYELAMSHNQMEKGLWSTSSLVIILAMLTKQDPKKIAELMVNDDAGLKEFSGKINEEIKKLEAEKHPATHKTSEDK
jgi:hypothetical protein